MQGFHCGDADYATHVARWITEWLWTYRFGSKGETIIVLDDDREGTLVGYGTWTHVEQIGSVVQPRHIEIAWFGVHLDYQGVRYEDTHDEPAGASGETIEAPIPDAPDETQGEASGPEEVTDEAPERAHTVAEVVYAEVERFAREHADSTDAMPITLTCHVENDRGLAFYRDKVGFSLIPDPKLQVERDIYYRMVR